MTLLKKLTMRGECQTLRAHSGAAVPWIQKSILSVIDLLKRYCTYDNAMLKPSIVGEY